MATTNIYDKSQYTTIALDEMPTLDVSNSIHDYEKAYAETLKAEEYNPFEPPGVPGSANWVYYNPPPGSILSGPITFSPGPIQQNWEYEANAQYQPPSKTKYKPVVEKITNNVDGPCEVVLQTSSGFQKIIDWEIGKPAPPKLTEYVSSIHRTDFKFYRIHNNRYIYLEV